MESDPSACAAMSLIFIFTISVFVYKQFTIFPKSPYHLLRVL